jgi:hypothetical protein
VSAGVLFGRLPIEVFFVCLCIRFGSMHYTVSMPSSTALPSPLLYPKQLIELVDFFTDIFTGLEAHHDELAILRRIQNRAERLVL